MPSKEYLESSALNFHNLSSFGRSGANKYRRRVVLKDLKPKSSTAFRPGRLWHTAILEPEKLKDWAKIPRDHFTAKGMLSTSRRTEKYMAELPPHTDAAGEVEIDHVVDMAQHVHTVEAEFMNSVTVCEEEIYTDLEGVPVKLAIDIQGIHWEYGTPYVGDLKTIENLEDWRNHIDNFDYRCQIAWYLRNKFKRAPSLNPGEGVILFVEKSTGCTQLVELDPEKLIEADKQNMVNFRNYQNWVIKKPKTNKVIY